MVRTGLQSPNRQGGQSANNITVRAIQRYGDTMRATRPNRQNTSIPIGKLWKTKSALRRAGTFLAPHTSRSGHSSNKACSSQHGMPEEEGTQAGPIMHDSWLSALGIALG